jgi:hypothetical protein
MLHIRALIQPERVIVFDTAGTVESEVQRRFKWHLERNVRAAIKAKEQGADGDEEMLAYEHRCVWTARGGLKADVCTGHSSQSWSRRRMHWKRRWLSRGGWFSSFWQIWKTTSTGII